MAGPCTKAEGGAVISVTSHHLVAGTPSRTPALEQAVFCATLALIGAVFRLFLDCAAGQRPMQVPHGLGVGSGMLA